MTSNILETIDRLKNELDALRPLPPDVLARVEQKLRIESNYHSNAPRPHRPRQTDPGPSRHPGA
jgi:hypothetical protein